MSLQIQPANSVPSPISGTVLPPEHRFKPGVSGNPHGVPKTILTARKLAAKASPEIIKRMTKIALEAEEKFAIPAAALVLERGLGKAAAMRELYPQTNPEQHDADVAGLSEDQQRRIFEILKEGKNA